MNRSLVFTPGCNWKIDRRILFVEYETVTGKPESKRFDLSAGTEYIVDGYKTLSFEEISKPESKLQYDIQKVVYFEKECNSMVAYERGCRRTRLFIPTKVYFNKIVRTTTRFNILGTNVGFRNDAVDARIEAYKFLDPGRCYITSQSIINNSDRVKMIQQMIAADELREDTRKQWLISDDLEDCEKGVPNTKLMSTGKLYFQDTMTGEMKPFEGIKSFTPKPMTFRGKTWTHPESTYGKQGHMLIVDINSKTFIPDDDYLDVEVGDVMWYDDGNNGKNEPDDHGKLFVWQGLGLGWKKLPDNSGYFDTDMAAKAAEIHKKFSEQLKTYGYCFGADFDGDTITITSMKKFEEELKMAGTSRFDIYKPKIMKVIFNDPATVVFWSDNTKTIVKCGENDDFDPEKGIAMACMKKLLGTNKTGSNYLDGVKNYISKWEEDNPEENVWTKLFGVIGTMTGENLVNTDAMDIPEEAEDRKPTEGGENNE